MSNAPAATTRRFATVKKGIVTDEEAEQKMREKFERRTKTVNQKRIFGQTNKTKAQLQRETHAAAMMLGPAAMAVDDGPMDPKDKEEADKLEAFLRSPGVSPFNNRWEVLKKLKGGTFGCTFTARDLQTNTMAVIKVERQSASNQSQNFGEWESFMLEKMFKLDHHANLVRVLDKGILQDPEGNNLEFAVIEYCQMSVRDYINTNCGPNDRKYRVLRVALGALKGLYDMHRQGILHRDVKPENMGMIRRRDGEFVCVLFDLGMARMFTDGDGYLRPPRTMVAFRGTPEWASGHALKYRDQTRFDDLIGWLYVAIELFDPSPDPETARPFPWDHCTFNKQAGAYLKTPYAPARLLLRHCPREFYSIHTYLMCANRLKVPDYMFIADLVGEAMFKQRAEVEKPKTTKEEQQRTQQKKEAAAATTGGGKRLQQRMETNIAMNRDFNSLA